MADLKSMIVLIHIVGLAFGLGGAWITDVYLARHIARFSITQEKFKFLKFSSNVVWVGLSLLWVSGLSFIVYYYFFTPEFLLNPKVWAKVSIVTLLTINGAFIHFYVLPIIKSCIGGPILPIISRKEAHRFASLSVISFFSWLIPLVLGVSKSINFVVPALTIVSVYLFIVMSALVVAHLVTRKIMNDIDALSTDQKIVLIYQSGQEDSEKISELMSRITGSEVSVSSVNRALAISDVEINASLSKSVELGAS